MRVRAGDAVQRERRGERNMMPDLTGAQYAELRIGLEQELRHLAPGRRATQILDALRRMDAGTYGICRGCQSPISHVRLSVIPETPLCVRCVRGGESSARSHMIRRSA